VVTGAELTSEGRIEDVGGEFPPNPAPQIDQDRRRNSKSRDRKNEISAEEQQAGGGRGGGGERRTVGKVLEV